MKQNLGRIIIIGFLLATVGVLRSRNKTYSSALDNSNDSISFQIYEIKTRKADRRSKYMMEQQADDELVAQLCDSYVPGFVPHDLIMDGTCE